MNNLKVARKAKEMTQAQVAAYIGISQNAYSYWESGRSKIDHESLNKLAELFGVSTDYLLGREEKKEPSLDEQLEGIDFALFDGAKGLTNHQKQIVIKFMKMLQEEENKEKDE